MDAKPDHPAKRVTWRGTQYDSQLESDWAATFTEWDMLFVYHPGRIYLSDSVWEPDFQLEGNLLFEVKGWHNDRIEKVHEAREAGYEVIVGRPGAVVGDNEMEFALAIWEGDYVLTVDPEGRLLFVPEDDETSRYGRLSSGDVAAEQGGLGIRWFKAVGEDNIV